MIPSDEITTILDNYDLLIAGTAKKRYVSIHGGRSTGKTAFLSELKDRLQYHNKLCRQTVDVFLATGKEDDGAIKALLKQLIKAYDDGGDPEFTEFLLSYIKGSVSEDTAYEKIALVKFIYDCVKTRTTVFIIDDFDKCDDFTISMFSRLIEVNVKLYLVFTRTIGIENELLTRFLESHADSILCIEHGRILKGDAYTSRGPLPTTDEAAYLLSEPGRENQLLSYYIKSGKQQIQQMAYEKAVATLCEALVLSRELGNKTTELDAMLKLGEALKKNRNITPAIDIFAKALALAEELDIQEKQAQVAIELADCHYQVSEYEKAREYAMQAEAFFNTHKRRKKHYDMYRKFTHEMLCILLELNEIELFCEKAKQAFEICLLRDEHFLSALFFDDGQHYLQVGDVKKAHDNFSVSRDMAKKSKNLKIWDLAMNSLAICNEYFAKPDVSMAMYEELIGKSHDPVRVANARMNYCTMQYAMSKDVNMAIENITMSMELCFLAEEYNYEFEHRSALIDVYMDADDYVSAYENMQMLQKIAESTQVDTSDRIYMLVSEARFFERVGDMARMSGYIDKALEMCEDNERALGVKQQLLVLEAGKKVLELADSLCETPEIKIQLATLYEYVKQLIFGRMEKNAYSCDVMFEFLLTVRHAKLLDMLSRELKTEVKRAAGFAGASNYFEVMLLYIQSLDKDGEEKLSILLKSLNKAAEQKRYRLIVYICEDLNKYYEGENERQLEYMAKARDAAGELLKNVPEEFHDSFAKRHLLTNFF
jgi:tetratricopeptide (TPR) repeat protein